MKRERLMVGEIVQLSPETCRNIIFGGCFLVVSEPKEFGAQGYVQTVGHGREAMGGQAYYRACWEEMERTGGFAQWVIPRPGGNEDAG